MKDATQSTVSHSGKKRHHRAPKEVFAGIVCYMLAPFGMGLLPLLGGAAVDRYGISGTEVGLLGTADLAGIAVSCVLSVFWVRKVSLRKAAWLSIAVLMVGNMFSWMADTFTTLCAARFITELGSGGMFSLALIVLGKSSNPERFLSLGIAATLASSVIAYLWLPEIIATSGIGVVFIAHLVVVVFAMFWLNWLPLKPASTTERSREEQSAANYLPLIFCFLSLFCLTIVQGGVWTYLERIGNAAGLSPDYIGNALAMTQVASLAGSLLTSLLSTRFGRLLPISLAMASLLLAFYLFTRHGAMPYVIAACITQFCYVFCLPYLMSLCVESDPSGKFYVLTNVFKLVGMASGPAVIALFLQGDNYLVVSIVGAVFTGLCLLFSAVVIAGTNAEKGTQKVLA